MELRSLRSAVAVAAVVVACGQVVPSPARLPTGSNQPPTATLSPGPTIATPSPISSSACTRGDVHAGGAWWAGATGSVQGGVHLYSTSTVPCTIYGPVGVRIIDDEGSGLPADVRPVAPDARSEVVLLPGLGAPTPEGGALTGRAAVVVVWTNWCRSRTIGPARFEIALPTLDPIYAPFARISTPRCDDPAFPSIVTVQPLRAEATDE
jgi:hypothetical protein